MPASMNPTAYYNKSSPGASFVDVSVPAATGEALFAVAFNGNEWSGAGSPTGIAWDPTGDNQAFTQVGTTRTDLLNLNGQATPVSLWRLAAVTTGKTAAVRASASATQDFIGCIVARVSGHDALDLVRAFNFRSEPDIVANNLTNTVTSASGDLCLYFGVLRSESAYINNSLGSLSNLANFPPSGMPVMFVGSKPGAATSTTGVVKYTDNQNYSNALLAVSIKSAPVVSDLTGNVTTADAAPSGSLATGASVLGGTVDLADAIASGTLGLQFSSVTTLPFSRNPGNGGRLASINGVGVCLLADDVNLARLNGAVLNMAGDGRLTFANGAPVPPGTSVICVTREPGPNGALGVERYITA